MINYDKKFNAEINSIVRRFNAKVARLEKEGLKYIPDRISVADLKATYFERDSLKRRLSLLENFSKRGAEEIVQTAGGAKTTRWELESLIAEREYLKHRYATRLKKYGDTIPTILGKKQAVSYARMGDARYENLKVLKSSMERNITDLDQYEYNRIKRQTYKQIKRYHRQKYVLWANYFQFLEDVAFKAGIDDETLRRIEDKLLKMDVDDFMRFFDTEKAFSSVIDYYNIQKLRSDGYSDSEIDKVKLMFQAIDELADEYL
ncbi:MAG: hypothetical protein J6S67_02240 [Methanobrevibacter sp.]|nr:hypothetical protein [Methanobrevibacter sp.]